MQAKLTIPAILAWFCTLASVPRLPAAQETEVPRESAGTSASAAIVRKLLRGVDARTRSAVVFPFDAPERQSWSRGPARRPGLMLKDLSEPQRGLLDRLLRSVLSDKGFEAVQGVIQEQDQFAGQETDMGAGYFWFAVYGEPGEGRWAWRLGGHHVSLHFTYDGTRVVSATPLHLGAEGDDDPRWTGYHKLRPRESLALELAASLDENNRAAARLEGPVPGMLAASEQRSFRLETPDRGLEVASLLPPQRARLDALIEENLGVLQPELADAIRTDIRSSLDRARLAWSGALAGGQAHYYRIGSTAFLIEYNNSGSHMHTILRTESDFGAGPAGRLAPP